MSGCARRVPARLAALTVGLALLGSGCEKVTHRAARAEFQEIQAHRDGPEAQAGALEAFVLRYPEAKTNPYLVRACSLLAEHHTRQGRLDIAASWYERAVRAVPDDPDLLNALGYLYAAHGMNLDRAVTVLESAVRLAGERRLPERRQGFIKDSLGWAYRMRGDLPLAVAILEEACRLAPGVGIIREHLAEAYRALGERTRAADILIDLYAQDRFTDGRLRRLLSGIAAEGGPELAGPLETKIAEARRRLEAADKREAAEDGGTLVHLAAADGAPLAGTLFLPAGTTGARPAPRPHTGAVLLLHALRSNRRAAAAQARAVRAAGLAALTLDLRGHGGSVSEAFPGPPQFTAHLAESLEAAALDARAGLDFLDRQPRGGRGAIGIVGAGIGGLVAARLAGTVPRRVAALVILSPWGRAEAYRDPIGLLSPGSVLLIHGSEEDPAASSVKTLSEMLVPAAAPPITVPGAASGFGLPERDGRLAERVAAFVAGRLR